MVCTQDTLIILIITNFIQNVNICFYVYGSEPLNLNEFEARLASVEAQLSTLDNLPVDKSFLAQSTNSDDSHTTAQDKKENALAMMWKYMKVQKRLQATEEAVEKVMNILNDVIEDVGHLKNVESHLEKLREEQMKMAGEFDALKNGGELTSSLKKKVGVWWDTAHCFFIMACNQTFQSP